MQLEEKHGLSKKNFSNGKWGIQHGASNNQRSQHFLFPVPSQVRRRPDQARRKVHGALLQLRLRLQKL